MECLNPRMREFLKEFDEKSKNHSYMHKCVYYLSRCNHCLRKAVQDGLIAQILTDDFAGPHLICLMKDWEQIKILRLDSKIAQLVLSILPLVLATHEKIVLTEIASPNV